MNRSSIAFAALGVASAAIAVAGYLYRDAAVDTMQARVAPSIDNVAKLEAATRQPSAASPVAVKSGAPLTAFGRMAAELSAATDLRVFAERAKQHPENGGIAYASLAVQQCLMAKNLKTVAGKSWEKSAALDPKHASDRLAALSLYERRCASFTDTEIRGAQELLKSGEQKDPVVVLRNQIRRQLTDTERLDLSARIMEMRDPYLLQNMPLLRAPKEGEAVYLDGKPYGGVERAEFTMAITLLPCAYGTLCDSSHESVVGQCITTGTCAKDLFELVQRGTSETPGSYERILGIYQRLRDVVAANEVGALARPSN